MNIVWSKTREKFPLSKKKIIKKTISSLIVVVLLFLALYAILFYFMSTLNQKIFGWIGVMTFVVVVVLLVISILMYLYEKWYFAVYFYDLTNDYIVIKKGPITPKEITIPYERVQDVYVDQDLLDRFFGLYDVHLSSATISSGMEAHIDGVEKEAAEGLRKVLLQTVQKKISK